MYVPVRAVGAVEGGYPVAAVVSGEDCCCAARCAASAAADSPGATRELQAQEAHGHSGQRDEHTDDAEPNLPRIPFVPRVIFHLDQANSRSAPSRETTEVPRRNELAPWSDRMHHQQVIFSDKRSRHW